MIKGFGGGRLGLERVGGMYCKVDLLLALVDRGLTGGAKEDAGKTNAKAATRSDSIRAIR